MPVVGVVPTQVTGVCEPRVEVDEVVVGRSCFVTLDAILRIGH